MSTIDRSLAWRVLAAVLIAAVFLTLTPNFASADIFGDICKPLGEVWDYGKKAVYVLAGIGILVMAVFAFFGRFKWSHLFSLGGGVLLVATAAELIEWLGGDGGIAC